METPTSQGERAPSRGKRIAARILLALFCLSMVLSLVAGWARLEITSTDRYVDTVAPLASDPSIQQALIDRVTREVSAQLDERVTIDLIEDRALAAPLAMVVEQFIRDTVTSFVMSDEFPVMWERINRASHALVTAVLTGSGTASISTDQGRITLDLAPLMTEVINRLGDRGLDIVDRIQVDRLDTTFVIYESEDLARAQDAVRLLERLAVALPILALVSLVAALVVSTDRRSTVVWAGLGLAGTMSLVLMLLAFLRWWVVDNLPPDANRQAATAFFETIGRYLRDAARVLTVAGLLTAGVAYVTGAASWAGRESRTAGDTVRAAWSSTRARLPGFARAGAWFNSHRVAIAAAIGVTACLLVVAWDPLDADQALRILIVMAAGFGVLALAHAWAPATTLMPVPATASPMAMTSAPVLDATPVRSGERVESERLPAADGSRDEFIRLAGDLSAEDLLVLRRVATLLRDTHQTG